MAESTCMTLRCRRPLRTFAPSKRWWPPERETFGPVGARRGGGRMRARRAAMPAGRLLQFALWTLFVECALAVRVAARPRLAVQMIFPSSEGELSAVVSLPPKSRQEQLTDLLASLAARPEDAPNLLHDATPMLLAPFLAEAPAEGSIFAPGMSLEEKIETYRETLEQRIGAARQPETKRALRMLSDHCCAAAAELLTADAG